MRNILVKEARFDEKFLEAAPLVDRFEGYAHAHAGRVAALSEAVARKFNFSAHDCLLLRQAALAHDIGEAAMKREYIKLNRNLTDEERFDMQRHTVIGEQEAAKRGLARAAQLLVRWHHEWWNGAGYPDALSYEQIPLAARILRASDTYAALTDARPFRAALSEAEARRHLTEWAGIEFDPRVAKAFLSLENLEELKSYSETKDE